MADYIYPKDGKIHLRFSDLPRCTPGQIDRLISEHQDPSLRFESESMEFGTLRHELWQEESKRTGMVPFCFKEIENGRFYRKVSHVEMEFAIELVPGVVIHCRPDGICEADKAIYDGKTVIDGVNGYEQNLAKYRTSKQTLFYCFVAGIHNIHIEEIWYLCEVWNQARDKIVCYRYVHRKPGLLEIASMKSFAIKAAALYKSEMKRKGLL